MSDLVLFAGASNGKKVVSIYHGNHLKYAPPVLGTWSHIAGYWLQTSEIGQWFIEGEKISNLKEQWVFVDVREI